MYITNGSDPEISDPFTLTMVVMAVIGIAVCLIGLSLLIFCIFFYAVRAIRNICLLFITKPYVISSNENSKRK